jgi:hypothetical protein
LISSGHSNLLIPCAGESENCEMAGIDGDLSIGPTGSARPGLRMFDELTSA